MAVSDDELREIGKAWATLGEFIPIRREGEAVPGSDSEGQFSIQWWRGPRLFYRRGNRVIAIGYKVYRDNEQQLVGPYVEESVTDSEGTTLRRQLDEAAGKDSPS